MKQFTHTYFLFLVIVIFQLLLGNLYASDAVIKHKHVLLNKEEKQTTFIYQIFAEEKDFDEESIDTEFNFDDTIIEPNESDLRINRQTPYDLNIVDFKIISAFFDIWFKSYTLKYTRLNYFQYQSELPPLIYHNFLFRLSVF